MDDLISRQAAIDALRNYLVGKNVPCDGTLTCRLIENEVINKLPTIHHEHGTNLAEVGTDCISRQKAIEAFNTDVDTLIVYGTENAVTVKRYLNGVLEKIKQLPSAEEESFEWCTDCKEYDQEAHCCHRWNKVIKNTLVERVTT